MTEAEKLLILNIIAYSNSLKSSDIKSKYGKPLKEFVGELEKPKTISDDDWNKIIEEVENNKEFSTVKLSTLEYKENKQVNILFIDSDNRALVVFKGTDNYEWHDNAKGGQWDVFETEQQKNANDFIINNCNGYSEVIVSGHSKGGNKAQYTAVKNNLVTKAYSFDGQGMGQNFILANRKAIEDNANKIFLYNYSSDYVNPLFINIGVENVKFIKSDKNVLDLLFEGNAEGLMLLHSPDQMLDFSGDKIRLKSDNGVIQDPACTLINGLTEYMMLHLNQEDWEYFSNLMVHMFENKEEGCSGEFDINKVPKGFLAHVLNEGIIYLTTKMGFSSYDAEVFIGIFLLKICGEGVFKELPILKGMVNDISIKMMKDKINSLLIETTGNDIVRDYTQEMQNDFQKLVKESQDDEPILEFWNWDVWTNISDYFNGGYTLEDADNDLIKYQKHMIDIENITVKEAERIFADIYHADQEFVGVIQGIAESIDKYNADIVENLIEKINLA